MIQLSVWAVEDCVKWQLVKIRPADQWRAHGPWYWERRGQIVSDDELRSDRELISMALKAIGDRLGERQDLGVGGE